ncbi:AAA family ATPase [Loktanella salsilacus]|uniref:AAA family ATPase n=1 Tax=Loktanella salsilacus TaxID=195913 RepID=UPI0030F8F9CC
MSTAKLHTVYTISQSRAERLESAKVEGYRRALKTRLADLRPVFTAFDLSLDDMLCCTYTTQTGLHLRWLEEPAVSTETLEMLTAAVWDKAESFLGWGMSRTGPASLQTVLEEYLTLPRDVLNNLIQEAEKVTPSGAVSLLDKEETLKRFLAAASGPLPLEGPHTVHAVDEMIARVHSRAPWLRQVTRRLWAVIRARIEAGQAGMGMPPLLLWGPGGTGKTMLASIMSEEAGVPVHEMDASTGSAGFRVAGVESGWSTRQIGEPLRCVAETRCANPLMVINELDKVGAGSFSHSGTRTSLVDALLPLLDPHSAARFRCPATGLLLDLSRLSWVFTANDLRGFSQPFLSRLEVIAVPRLTLPDYEMAAQVMCGPDDPELLSAIGRFVSATHARPGFSLRHVARAVERGRTVGPEYPFH